MGTRVFNCLGFFFFLYVLLLFGDHTHWCSGLSQQSLLVMVVATYGMPEIEPQKTLNPLCDHSSLDSLVLDCDASFRHPASAEV